MPEIAERAGVTVEEALAGLTDQPWTLLVAGDHHGDLGPQMQA